MWIIPINYELSHSAQAFLESKEELSLLEPSLEHSLMWRSKPSPLPTWSRRWKRVPWLQALFGRTLKPCHWNHFEARLTSSLVATPANHSALQESDLAKKTQDTSGHGYVESSTALCPECVSLRTSKGTLPTDCDKCSLIWKQEVIRVRGGYSARKNAALLTEGKGCLSWPTPSVAGCVEGGVAKNVEMTPSGFKATRENGTSYGAKLRDSVLHHSSLWPTPTPTARDGTGTASPADMKRHSPSLPCLVHMDGQPDQDKSLSSGKSHELNPRWVEQLMGLTIGSTSLGCWGTA